MGKNCQNKKMKFAAACAFVFAAASAMEA